MPYGNNFALRATFSPYLSGDLILANLDRYVGRSEPFSSGSPPPWLVLPIAVVSFVLREQRASGASTGAILAFYISTDWFFAVGSISFQLGIGWAIFAYAFFLRACKNSDAGAFLCYAFLVLVDDACHSCTIRSHTFTLFRLFEQRIRRETGLTGGESDCVGSQLV